MTGGENQEKHWSIPEIRSEAARQQCAGRSRFMANPKIDRQTAEQIRKEWKQGWKQRVLQIRHGLSRAQIGRIVRGEAHA